MTQDELKHMKRRWHGGRRGVLHHAENLQSVNKLPFTKEGVQGIGLQGETFI